MHRFKRLLLIIILILLAAELAAGVFISDWASPEQFERFASAEEYETRYSFPALELHRFTAYTIAPDWARGLDRHGALGYRGEEISLEKPAGTFRIVCLGGSTTYSMGVEDFHLSYPYLLQEALAVLGYTSVEVINAGVPGYRSLEALLALQFRVLDLSPDLIILNVGLSDVSPRLVWPPEAYRGDQSGFLDPPVAYYPPQWAHSDLMRILMVGLGLAPPQSQAARSWEPLVETAQAAEYERQWAAGVYPSGIFRSISAEEMLAANPPVFFEHNVRNLVTTAQVTGVQVLLLTYPSAPEFSANPQVASPVYQSGLAEHNDLLRTIAADMDVPLFDLASELPKEAELFTDGDDYTAFGNQARAERIAGFLAESGLLDGQ